MGISSGDRDSCVLISEALGGGVDGINRHTDRSDELFERLCSTENLFAAWQKFRRGKRSKADVMAYERNLEENLFSLQDVLQQEAYVHGAYQPFTIYDPKKRRIHKATVKDRVVHQALTQIIEPIFERQFIYDSFSCRTAKGTHAAVQRLQGFLRQGSRNNTRTVYALKCDIQKFFASVDHAILLGCIRRRVADARTLALMNTILKSFTVMPGKGLPLGNLTSQIFANVYLHELDWFIKHTLRGQWYIRYCDDFVIVHSSFECLFSLIAQIEGFLWSKLALQLHRDKIFVRSWTQGIDFLGYVLLPDAIVLRTKAKRRMLQKVNERNSTSYLGLCSHAASYHLQQIIKTKVGL